MGKIIVLGADYCKWCQKAIFLLESDNIEYEYYDIETKKGKIIHDYFKDSIPIKHNSIPIILEINDKFIGGFDNLYKLITSKKRKKKSKKKSKKNS